MVARGILGTLVLVVLGAAVLLAEGTEEPASGEAFTLKVTGQKTWGIQLGFGDATLLSSAGIAGGQLTLTQSLWTQIEGSVLDFLTVRASFNDQLGPGFQEFLVLVDREPWHAEIGRFVVGAEGDALGVYNKRVLGARVTVSREDLSLGALLARLEGISESLTFRGTTGQAELTFHYEDPRQPWRPAPYLASVEGLFFFELVFPFVEGFSRPALAFRTGPPFRRFLTDWGLDYLVQIAEKNAQVALSSGTYLVIQDEGDVLLLRHEPNVLLRNRILELIDLYNTVQGLSGTQRKTYPFVEGGDLEIAFLTALAAFAEIRVDDEAYPLDKAERHRYLSLGETGIVEDSLGVEIRLPGEDDFRPLIDPILSRYSVQLLAERGILRIDFPQEFFRTGAALRARFQYAREGVAFFLGLSIIPGSERVYLNGELLVRNVDYSIDYAAGLLTLFAPLGAQDELRVDFERQRGALGVSTEYERYFLGATLAWGPGQLGVWQAADLGVPDPTSRTMPNAHSLLVLSWQGELGAWDYTLRLGLSQNVFPFDDNARLPGRNRVNAIVPTRTAEGEVLIFAHQNGLTVYRSGRFFTYGSAEGLAGRAVLSLLPLEEQLLIGTDAGLTIVDLTLPGAFDRVRSWTRLYPEDWNRGRTDKFRGTRVVALAREGDHVYMATEAEIIEIPVASLRSPAAWRGLDLPPGEPTVLHAAQGLYLGTTDGLYRLSPEGWDGLGVSDPVFDLLSRGDELFVAGPEGIRVLRGGQGAGWVTYGVPVRAMAIWQGFVWYATEDGVYREGERVVPGDFTALGIGLDGLWAGSRADPQFQMELWRLDPEPERFPWTKTGVDGRDLGYFRDPPAQEHTRVGPAASFSLSRRLEAWDLGVRLYSRFPGYEEIGAPGRSDAHGMGVVVRYLGDPALSLTLTGNVDLAHLSGDPGLRLSGGVEGLWKGPVEVSFSLTPTVTELTKGAQLSSGFRLGLSYGSNPSWTLGIGGTLTTPAYSMAGTFGGRVSYRPWPGLALSLSWSRPYRSHGSPGQENLSLRAQLTGGTGHVWTLAGEEVLSRTVGTPTWRSSRSLSGELRLAPLAVGEGRLAPIFSAVFSQTPAEWRISGNASGTVEIPGHRFSLRLNAGHSARPTTERTERSLGFSVSWTTSAWGRFKPSLSYARSWRILLHPRYIPQVSERASLEAKLGFDLPRGQGELSLGWAPDEGIKILNRLRFQPEFGPTSLVTTFTLKEGKVSAKTELEAMLTLAPQWGLNVRGGFLLGASPVRVAGYLGATLAASF